MNKSNIAKKQEIEEDYIEDEYEQDEEESKEKKKAEQVEDDEIPHVSDEDVEGSDDYEFWYATHHIKSVSPINVQYYMKTIS